MIVANIQKGKQCKIIASGDGQGILTDIASMISSIYGSLKANDENLAREFRHLLTMLVTDPESVIWNNMPKGTGTVIVTDKE